jgi:hypothetical protein
MINNYLTFILLAMASSLFAQQPAPESPAPIKFPFEKSNAVVKYDCTQVNLNADGTSETLKHYRAAVLTERGIREYAQDVTVYNLGYDTVQVIAARVHLPSGKVIEVDTSAIKDVPMPAFGKFFMQNVREKIISFPELTPGAEIEVVFKQITREPPMDGQFDLTEGFEHSDPIQTKYVELAMPSDKKLYWKARNGDIPHSEITANNKTTHVWTLQNMTQMVPEPGMPPVPEVTKLLFATTVKDWETWSKWYDNLSEPMMVADDDVKAMVKQLTAGKTTREDKIREIFYFCSNQIRYVETALTGKKAGYKPESASVTFRNKYGVCRDKAALMVTMLREAGIQSDITLMNPAWKIDKDIAVDQFNHAIVAVHEPDGKTTFIDPTVEKTKDYLAANEQDRGVLVCNKKGEDLTFTPVEPSEQNLYEIKAESKLEDDGKFRSTVTISTRGFPDLILRNMFQARPPEERVNTFKQIVQSFSPTAVLDTFIVTDLMDFSKQVEIRLQFHATDYSIPAGKYLLFQLPNQASGLDFLTQFFLRGSELTTRRYELKVPSTFAVRAEEQVSYPKGYKIRSLPEEVNLDYGDFKLAREFESVKNGLRVKRVFDMRSLRIPLNQYSKLQEALKAESTMGKGQVVLEKQ